MEYYSFQDKKMTRQDLYEGDTFDLFKPTLIDVKLQNLPKTEYIVPIEFEGRMDRISEYLYNGENKYTEELMKINNIINAYSIKAGTIIYNIQQSDLAAMYNEEDDSKGVDVLNINNPKNSTVDSNRQNKILPPIVKDRSVKQLSWNKDNKSVTINNKN